MLKVILSTEKEKVDKEILKSAKDSQILKIDEFNWDPDLVRSKVSSSSLFATAKEVIVLDGLSKNSEIWELLKSMLQGIVEWEGEAFIVEAELKKEEVEFLEILGAKVVDLKIEKKMEYDFSPFALQDAIGLKSAKNAWIEYQKLRQLNIEAEEICPKIVNKLRDMLAISKGAKKEDLGIKSDFPYNKSKKDLKNWTAPYLEELYKKSIQLYHDSRMYGRDLDSSLEKMLLSL